MKTSRAFLDEQEQSPASQLAGVAVTCLLVLLSTALGMLIAPRWGTGSIVLLYLLPVLVGARFFGLRPALLAAVAGALAFNYFFTEPRHTFRISDPADILTAVMLLAVALVTGQLAGMMRHQALLARASAARNATIAGLANRLLACHDAAAIAQVVVNDLVRLFDCQAIFVLAGPSPVRLAEGPGPAALAPSDDLALAHTLATGEATGRGVRRADVADWQFRPVVSDKGVVAAVGLARPDGRPAIAEPERELLDNLLDQAALALDRAASEAEARALAASHERDRLRAALLASIGDDIKPGLLAILAAARKLRRTPGDSEAAGAVLSHAGRLEQYVDNLVAIEPGEEQQPIAIGPVSIDLFRRTVMRHGEPVHLTPKEFAVLSQLARHGGRVLTHQQLLRAVWGPAHEGNVDYLRVAIRSLRQKLEDQPDRPQIIINEPAVGYRIALPA